MEKMPRFNKHIFRDVKFEQIDYDAKANFVIERVFEDPMLRISVNEEGITEMKK